MIHDDLPESLRWQLRGLRRDETPERDLWPAIAAALPSASVPPVPRRARRWLLPLSAAAGVAVAIGALGLLPRLGPASAGGESLVQREAEGMTRQYQAALRELPPAPQSSVMQPAIDVLDRDAALIRRALAHDPDSRLLLEQLQHTYSHRVALARRVANG